MDMNILKTLIMSENDVNLIIFIIMTIIVICGVLWVSYFQYLYEFKHIKIGDIYIKEECIDEDNPRNVKIYKYKIVDKKNNKLLVIDLNSNMYDIMPIYHLVDNDFKLYKETNVTDYIIKDVQWEEPKGVKIINNKNKWTKIAFKHK